MFWYTCIFLHFHAPCFFRLHTGSVDPFVESLFYNDVRFGTERSVSGYTVRYPCERAVRCAVICLQNVSCNSFFFTKPANICQLHDTVLDYNSYSGTGLLETVRSSKYYIVGKPLILTGIVIVELLLLQG